MMLNEIVSSICREEPFNLKKDNGLINQLSKNIEEIYYKNSLESFSYTEILFCIRNMKADDFDYLLENLKILCEKAKGNEKRYKSIFKLKDYIELEISREYYIKNVAMGEETVRDTFRMGFQKLMEQEESLRESVETEIIKINHSFKKQAKEIDNINGNLISVLGIFGAIIVAFFGGLNLLGSVLSNIDSVSIYRLSFMAVIVITGLFNIIFLLLHSVGKLTGKKIWSTCKENIACKNGNTNSNCIYMDNKIECLYMKYPLLIIFNLASIYTILTICIMKMFDKYNFIKYTYNFIGDSIFTPIRDWGDNLPSVAFIVVGVVIFGLAEFILYEIVKFLWKKLKKANKCNYSNTEENQP